MTTKEISLKIWEENQVIILTNKGEADSRYLKVFFTDSEGNNISLDGKEVTFYALKPDGAQVFNSCEVSTTDSSATLMITSQILSSVGILECEFQIFDTTGRILKANGIKIIVSSKGDFLEAVESTSEYSALVEAINEANNFSNSIGDLLTLNTNEKSSVIGAINEVNSKTIPISQGGTGAVSAESARVNLDVEKEYVLYSNSSGTYGTITLPDNYTNYNRIKVFFNDNNAFNSTEFFTAEVSTVVLDNVYLGTGNNSNTFYIHSVLLNFSGSSVTFSRNGLVVCGNTPSINIIASDSEGIKVNRILGYKH